MSLVAIDTMLIFRIEIFSGVGHMRPARASHTQSKSSMSRFPVFLRFGHRVGTQAMNVGRDVQTERTDRQTVEARPKIELK